MSREKFRGFTPVVLFFLTLNVFFILGKSWLLQWNASQNVLITGNLFLFFITFFSFFLAQKGLKNPNPHAFVRAVYVSIMLKLFACIIAAFAYISIYKTQLNKPALFICMGLYLVYTFIEVFVLTKLLKHRNNE